MMPSPTPYVRLLIPLIGQIPDFAEFVQNRILELLLKLVGAYSNDEELHHLLGNAIAQLLEQVLGVAIGLAIGLEKSERIGRELEGMVRPTGLPELCAAMRTDSIECRPAV
jgi:hypothetical protein